MTIGPHPLHAYGSGPFCKFKIPNRGYETFGVYALIIDGDQAAPRYVGKTENLAKRFNMGYGNISPKNCFRGGQQTNYRLNTLFYGQIAAGHRVDLWFALGGDIDEIERQLIVIPQSRVSWDCCRGSKKNASRCKPISRYRRISASASCCNSCPKVILARRRSGTANSISASSANHGTCRRYARGRKRNSAWRASTPGAPSHRCAAPRFLRWPGVCF